MTQDYILHLARDALTVTLLLAAPPLLVSLVVGLLVGILQAMTQIQEQTLSFVPKLVAVLVTLLIFSTWMMNTLLSFTQNLYEDIARLVG